MSKIPPDLTHMPPHIKQMIINSSDTATKLCQRKLSRAFKCEVDKAPIRYFESKMVIWYQSVLISRRITEGGYMNHLEFCNTGNGYSMKNDVEGYEKEMKGDYRKAAVAKLLSVFKHSKVSVEQLSFFVNRIGNSQANDTVIFDEFSRILSQKPFLIRVEKLSFDSEVNQQHIISVLRYLKPITLKEIELFWRKGRNERNVRNVRRLDIDEIVKTEQWMRLERVLIPKFQIEIPLEKWSHLNEVNIQLPAPPTETIVRILKTFLLKPTLKRLLLHWSDGDLDTTRVKEYVGRFEKIPKKSTEDRDCIRLPYEGNNQVYIAISADSIRIERHSFSITHYYP